MKNQTVQYYMHDGPSAFRFELAGKLNDDGARRLTQDWHTASSVMGGRQLIVDITFLTACDHAGRALLTRWHGAGAKLIAKSPLSHDLAESIVGAVPQALVAAIEGAASDSNLNRTWAPFQTSWGASKRIALLLAFLMPLINATSSADAPSSAELTTRNSAFSALISHDTTRFHHFTNGEPRA